MSEKREVLKILESDASKKIRAIKDKWEPNTKRAESLIKSRKDGITKLVNAVIEKALKQYGAKVNERMRVSFDDDWGGISIRSDKDEALVELSKNLEAIVAKRDAEIAEVEQKASSIRRRITLHGVDAEVLEMLESL